MKLRKHFLIINLATFMLQDRVYLSTGGLISLLDVYTERTSQWIERIVFIWDAWIIYYCLKKYVFEEDWSRTLSRISNVQHMISYSFNCWILSMIFLHFPLVYVRHFIQSTQLVYIIYSAEYHWSEYLIHLWM